MRKTAEKGVLRRLAALCLAAACLAACAAPSSAEEDEIPFLYAFGVDEVIRGMSLHEKVCQLFFLQPESFSRLPRVTAADEAFLRALDRWPAGGIILFSENIREREIRGLTAGMREASLRNGIGLFIGVDEEGGSVSRLADPLGLPERQPAPRDIPTAEDAYASALAIGGYLREYGFNVNLAPVADIRMDVKAPEIISRAYGTDPKDVAEKVARFVEGMHDCRIIPALKHFPGHGAVSGSTHAGSGASLRTEDDWRSFEFIPFEAGIGAGAEMVLLSHQLALNVDPDVPASLSPKIVSMLREELGFGGVIITDALRMGAVHKKFGSGEACVRALEAGADMLLLPYNFTNAYNGVMEALETGRLTESRIDESLRRILALKASYGLLPAVTDPDR